MKMRHNDDLTQMLRETDVDHRYRKYDAGYHDDVYDSVIMEYGFDDLKVYIPRMWSSNSRTVAPAKREILSLAYRRSLGERVPSYGPKALAWMYLTKGYVADRHYRDLDVSDMTIEECRAIGMSHWTISKKTGKYMIRRFDFDEGRDTEPAPKWSYYYSYV